MTPRLGWLSLSAALLAAPAFAQYNLGAGKSAPAAEPVRVEKKDAQGVTRVVVEQHQAPRDSYGNAQGHKYDLAVDGAFDGQTVLVLDYYDYDFSHAAGALREKGFSVVRLRKAAPEPAELKKLLARSNQFWLLASCDDTVHLTPAHHQVIKEFFDAGHGVYLWGDNDPCNADADKLASLLVDARVKGDLPGDTVVGLSKGPGKPGVFQDHLLTTGLEHIYEGVTVATVKPAGAMTPIVWGSAGNLVTAAFESGGKRLIIDGGFTRLGYKWDSAGTGRYVKNAAAWLANHERFGDGVVADRFKKK